MTQGWQPGDIMNDLFNKNGTMRQKYNDCRNCYHADAQDCMVYNCQVYPFEDKPGSVSIHRFDYRGVYKFSTWADQEGPEGAGMYIQVHTSDGSWKDHKIEQLRILHNVCIASLDLATEYDAYSSPTIVTKNPVTITIEDIDNKRTATIIGS